MTRYPDRSPAETFAHYELMLSQEAAVAYDSALGDRGRAAAVIAAQIANTGQLIPAHPGWRAGWVTDDPDSPLHVQAIVAWYGTRGHLRPCVAAGSGDGWVEPDDNVFVILEPGEDAAAYLEAAREQQASTSRPA
jgi:hypothetical protein